MQLLFETFFRTTNNLRVILSRRVMILALYIYIVDFLSLSFYLIFDDEVILDSRDWAR